MSEMPGAPRSCPARLYKYRAINEHTFDMLERHTVYFSSPDDFNDPFDCGVRLLCGGVENRKICEDGALRAVIEKHPDMEIADAVDAAQQVANRIMRSHRKQWDKLWLDKLLADTNDRVGILCLTEVRDDILMWSHYADCHKGICIELTPSEDSQLMSNVQPVEYSRTLPTMNLLDIVNDANLRSTAPWMLTKSPHWQYEKEWRVLDFDSGPGIRTFAPACLTGVIFGCRTPSSAKRRISAIAKASHGRVRRFQARKAANSFSLEIQEIR